MQDSECPVQPSAEGSESDRHCNELNDLAVIVVQLYLKCLESGGLPPESTPYKPEDTNAKTED
jgi:hypothetical protein